MNRADARELPIQTDRADEGGTGELVVIDVIHFQPAGIDVPQQQIGFAGDAAEIANARELPIEPYSPDEGGIGDLVVGDVVDLQSAGIRVAQEHVAFATSKSSRASLRCWSRGRG